MWQVKCKQEIMRAKKKEFEDALSKGVETVSKISLITSEKKNS